jgi:UDP-N-acetylmuramoylalanine--D-glutamate ligase
MKITDLKKETIALVGLGPENYSLIEFLIHTKEIYPLTIFALQSRGDMEQQYPKLKNWKHITWNISKPTFNNLKKFSLIIRTPGSFFSPKLRRDLKKNHTQIISPMQLFLDFCPTKNTIGVTGTKGKGTTASLIYSILKTGGKRVWIGGNIGVAPFSFILKIKKTDWVILELSSFQLEDMTTSPHISVLTNFSPEHLAPSDKTVPNYHPTLSSYWNAKYNLIRYQKKNDLAIINQVLKNKTDIKKVKTKKTFFTTSTLFSNLPGDHNKENIAAAVAVARAIGLSIKTITTGVKKFKGLPFRLEKIIEKNEITYYNDSFATTPTATITALKAFKQPILLIAGGADKGSDFTTLAKIISKQVKHLILFKGRALPKIMNSLRKAKYNPKNITQADSMSKALSAAQKQAVSGDIILMSPACASFGLFKNYKDRGEQFNKLVKE